MIDFLLGALAAGGIALLVAHIRARIPHPPNGTPLTIAQTLLQGLELVVANTTQGLIGRIDGLEATVADRASDLRVQIDGLRVAHAADLAALNARIDSLTGPR